ncbi:transposase [Streptomyces sp. SID4948]|nr:transposase [Streptomyces sp. SID4948]
MARICVPRRGPGRPPDPARSCSGRPRQWVRAIRTYRQRRGIRAAIPQPSDQIGHRPRRGRRGGRPPRFDRLADKQRNTVERGIKRLEQRRGLAMPTDKLAIACQAAVHFRHPAPAADLPREVFAEPRAAVVQGGFEVDSSAVVVEDQVECCDRAAYGLGPGVDRLPSSARETPCSRPRAGARYPWRRAQAALPARRFAFAGRQPGVSGRGCRPSCRCPPRRPDPPRSAVRRCRRQ